MKLSVAKLDKLSDIGIAMGQVFFASVFIEPIISGNVDWIRIISGLGFSLCIWSASLLLIKEING
jgi:hypothetical protein